MRVNGSGQSHDAGPLYWGGRPMGRLAEVSLYLLINPATLLIVYPSLLIWAGRAIWSAL